MGRLTHAILERWRTSSHFMAHRFGRLGAARGGFGLLMEALVWTYSRAVSLPAASGEPQNILILRNNDLGDLLVTTPLFAALRRRFPQARISVAIGAWNRATLQNNPNIDEVLVVSAPWYNHFIADRSIVAALRYIFFSSEVRQLSEKKFDLMIDIVGTHFGSLLGLRLKIPRRLGVKGYAGGQSGMTDSISFTTKECVPRANLRFAELLGATDLPPARPQLFLLPEEIRTAEQEWAELGSPAMTRIILGPGVGGDLRRSWPIEFFAAVVQRLTSSGQAQMIVVGGPKDKAIGAQIVGSCAHAKNRCGDFTLRQTFAAVSTADLVVCNASMLSHVAAAFTKPTIVLLGERYPSARAESELWGYDTCAFYGKEGLGTQILSPDEAIAVIEKKLAGINPSKREVLS